MYVTLLVIFLLVSIVLIAMVMLQQGKGTDIGASVGASASTTLFGSSGSGNFMTRMTIIFAVLFFIISLILGNLSSNKNITKNKWEDIDEPIKVEESVGASTGPIAVTSDVPLN